MRGRATRLYGVAVLAGVVWVSGTLLSAQAAPPARAKEVPAEAKAVKNPVPSTPASIATGSQLYTKYCRFCHGNTGLADSPMAPKHMKPSNLADATWDLVKTDGEMFWVIQNGAPPAYNMKGLKGKVADGDIWHIVNFVRSLASGAKSH